MKKNNIFYISLLASLLFSTSSVYATEHYNPIDKETTEDKNNNGILDDGEDLNGNGVLDNNIGSEDFNNNGILDEGEDLNGNGELDTAMPDGIVDGLVNGSAFSCNGDCQLGKVPDNPFIPEEVNKSKLIYNQSESLAKGVISVQTSYSEISNYLELNVIHQDAATSADAVLLLVGENRNNVIINNYKYLAFTVDENKDGSNATGEINLEDDDGGSFDSVIKVEADYVVINNYNDAVINALDHGTAIKILGKNSYINQMGSNGVIRSVDTAIVVDNSANYEKPLDTNLDNMDNADFQYNHKIQLSGFFSYVEGVDGYGIYSLDGESISVETTAFTEIRSINSDAIRIEGKHHYIKITNGSTDSLIQARKNHYGIYVYGDSDFENRFDLSNPYSSATISAGAFDEDLDGDGNIDVNEDANGNGILDEGEDLDGDGKLDTVNEDTDGNGSLDKQTAGSIAVFSNADVFNLTNSGKMNAWESVLRLGEETSRFKINLMSGSEIFLFSDYSGTAVAAIDIQGAVKGGDIILTASSANLSVTAQHATNQDLYGNAILVKNTDDVNLNISGSNGYKSIINGSIIFESGNNINIDLNEGAVINTSVVGSGADNGVAIDIENTTESNINLGGQINGDILLGSNTMTIYENTELNGKLYMGTGSVLNISGTLTGQDDAIDGSLAADAEINFTCITNCDVNLNLFKDIEETEFTLGSKVNIYAAETGDVRIKNINFEDRVTLNLYENEINGNDTITFDSITAKRSNINLHYTNLVVNNNLDLTYSSNINVYASGNKSGKLTITDGVLAGSDDTARVNIRPEINNNSIIEMSKEYNIMTVVGGASKQADYEYLFQDTLVVYNIEYEDNGSDLDMILTRNLYSAVLNDNSIYQEGTLLYHNTKDIVQYLDTALIFNETQGFQNSVINGIDSQAVTEDNVALAINSINPQDINFLYVPAIQAFTNATNAIDNHLKYTMLKSLQDRRWITGNINTSSFKDSYNASQNITTLSATGGYDIIKTKTTRSGVGASTSYSSSNLNFNTTDTVKNNMFALSAFAYQTYMNKKFYANTYLLTSVYGYNTSRNALYNMSTGVDLTANHFRAGVSNVTEVGYVFGSLRSKYLNLSVFNEAFYASGAEYDEGNEYNSITIDYDAQLDNYIGTKAEFVYLGTIIDINSDEYKLSASLNSELAYNLLYDEEYVYDAHFTNDPSFAWNPKYYNSYGKVRTRIGADFTVSDGSVSINFGYKYTLSDQYKENSVNIKAYKSF